MTRQERHGTVNPDGNHPGKAGHGNYPGQNEQPETFLRHRRQLPAAP